MILAIWQAFINGFSKKIFSTIYIIPIFNAINNISLSLKGDYLAFVKKNDLKYFSDLVYY